MSFSPGEPGRADEPQLDARPEVAARGRRSAGAGLRRLAGGRRRGQVDEERGQPEDADREDQLRAPEAAQAADDARGVAQVDEPVDRAEAGDPDEERRSWRSRPGRSRCRAAPRPSRSPRWRGRRRSARRRRARPRPSWRIASPSGGGRRQVSCAAARGARRARPATPRHRCRAPTAPRPGRASLRRPPRGRSRHRRRATRQAASPATSQPRVPPSVLTVARAASERPTSASAPTRARAAAPTEVDGSVSSGAPVSAHWTPTTPTVPTADRIQPIAAIARRSGAGRRATATAANAAPMRTTRPDVQEPAGDDRRRRAAWPTPPVSSPGGPLGGATPTPKANDPAETWPSTAETVRHETVYTPSGSSSVMTPITASPAGSPTNGSPVTWSVPLASSTRIDVRRRSGVSLKTSRTLSGGRPSVDPGAGSDRCSSAWADTPAGAATAARIATAASTSPTRPRELVARATPRHAEPAPLRPARRATYSAISADQKTEPADEGADDDGPVGRVDGVRRVGVRHLDQPGSRPGGPRCAPRCGRVVRPPRRASGP